MLYMKDAQISWISDIARPKLSNLYKSMFCPASLGQILSEIKGERRH